MSGWDDKRLTALKAMFEKRGKIFEKLDGEDKAGHDAKLAEGQELPESLKKLLQKGAKWRFDNFFEFDDGACNLYLTLPDETTCIFGDEDSRKEWLDENKEGAAGENWAMVCSTSEFDYYFVNIEKTSKNFGQVNWIKNNGPEEKMFTPAPFDKFLDAVEAWSKDSVTKKPDGDDPPEYEDLIEFMPSKRAKTS
mmetsp:Transcript_95433/g.168609  ORF Transcript_95433/g.168609 Transcript_95433/m.168609 type:complete len:194 (-) Transcript_95433:84-665(-)